MVNLKKLGVSLYKPAFFKPSTLTNAQIFAHIIAPKKTNAQIFSSVMRAKK